MSNRNRGAGPVNKAENSDRVVGAWIKEVEGFTRRLESAIPEFTHFSETYESMRDECSNAKTNGQYNKDKVDELKENVDKAYMALYAAKETLCGLKAGGARRRKTRRNRRN